MSISRLIQIPKLFIIKWMLPRQLEHKDYQHKHNSKWKMKDKIYQNMFEPNIVSTNEQTNFLQKNLGHKFFHQNFVEPKKFATKMFLN